MAEYIKRDSVLEALMYAFCGTGYQGLAMMEIRTIPVEDVAPVVHGQWVKVKPVHYQCSVCGINTGGFTSNYCPNCGAKMDEEERK